MSDIYRDGEYLSRNPGWHAADSGWKADLVASLLTRNGIRPTSVCDVGCGAGQVLTELAGHLPGGTRFDGYDVSPDAYALAAARAGDRIRFHHGSPFGTDAHFDVALAIDVIEHVEDYFSFLREFRTLARHKVFHIPLEIAVLMVARTGPLLHQRTSVGHLHHFTAETALASLTDTGYRIVDSQYTSGRTELPNLGWKTRALKGPRTVLARFSTDAAARWLGGYSLLVLAQ